MRHFRVAEEPHDMDERVVLAHLGQQLSARPFAAPERGAGGGEIDVANIGRRGFLRMVHLAEHGQPRVRHLHHADVRALAAAEAGLRVAVRHGVEHVRFAGLREPQNTDVRHRCLLRRKRPCAPPAPLPQCSRSGRPESGGAKKGAGVSPAPRIYGSESGGTDRAAPYCTTNVPNISVGCTSHWNLYEPVLLIVKVSVVDWPPFTKSVLIGLLLSSVTFRMSKLCSAVPLFLI